ncbi:hypothetical protein [Acinetobacter baumannii]|uniref:hypothetical protein n=1 Tax=Acinetobacter baumannii TaxID=470 RepID=UPI003D2258AE
MLEESVGSEKPASTWTAGPADLNAIKNALDTKRCSNQQPNYTRFEQRGENYISRQFDHATKQQH